MKFKPKPEQKHALISECGKYQIAKYSDGQTVKYMAFAKGKIVGEAVEFNRGEK